jgi:arginine decarboxylase
MKENCTQEYGTRYPTLCFYSGGAGQAQDGIPPQPFETFCYDSALKQAKIENFNVIPYTSVLPKELYGNIVPVDKVVDSFHHGAVLEVIMAGNGANINEHKAIATGIGICWGKDKKGNLIGGWAAEYVEYFSTPIDDEIAEGHAKMWLNKSLNHELMLRGVEKHSEFQFFHNYLNLTQPFGYCLTVLGFLNFRNAAPVVIKK